MTEILRWLAGKYETPLVVYDLEVVRGRVAELAGVLDQLPESRLFYSFKANPLQNKSSALCPQLRVITSLE
jgi:diaminopimelate decarboxylase